MNIKNRILLHCRNINVNGNSIFQPGSSNFVSHHREYCQIISFLIIEYAFSIFAVSYPVILQAIQSISTYKGMK